MEQAKTMLVADFKLSAETNSEKVIRYFIHDSYNESVPQLFKEVGIEIHYIAVVKKHRL